ncbi:twin-arginine translocase TatA/TatE family subunit [Arcobacter caeni]|uniref:Sec-independent protein translocase protein TatA n=1 Tax=Arcobacter caeni TaxID=1912877 RepID=A0A363D0U6_9BACT|nr:twin-arginine translocase TatA/TatE family subunit [Arcobacter caeni]PUE64944.1 Sec-independent protein translocase TatA [Arcobacter caeni]
MSMPSGMELLMIVLVILLMFGGKKIPELAKGLGTGIRNFKKAIKDDEDEVVQNKSDEIEKKSETTTTEKNETKQV